MSDPHLTPQPRADAAAGSPEAGDGTRRPVADVRLLVPALVAWAATAVAVGVPRPAATLGGTALLLAATGTLGTRLRPGRRGRDHLLAGGWALPVATVLGVVGLCVAAAGLQGWHRDAGPLRSLALHGATVRLQAVVVSDPRATAGPSAVGGRPQVLVRLAVRRVEGEGAAGPAHGTVLAFAPPTWSALRWGQTAQVGGRLTATSRADDVVALLDGRGPAVVLQRAGPGTRALQRVRDGLTTACAGLPPDARGLLPGLVVGDTTREPPDLLDAMRRTGLTHLAAVSGSNTTLVCLLAGWLAGRAGLGRRSRLVVAALVLGAFVVLTRAEPSVLRATVTAVVGLLAAGTGRRRAAAPALAAAVVVLLVADPWLARSAGFVLSVLATLGLVLLAPALTGWLARWLPPWAATAVALPVAAQALCGPVLVLLAGSISLVAVPANLLCEPLVAPCTVLGLVAALLCLVAPGPAAVVARVAGWGCTAVAAVARGLAAVPGGQLRWPGGPVGALSLAVLTLAAVAAAPWCLRQAARHPGPTRLVLCGAVGAAVAVRAPLPVPAGWPPTGWVMVACDVGQGDAEVLSAGPGRAVLVDTGPVPGDVDRCLHRLGVRQLDLVVLTHFHADHVGGLVGALHGRRAAALEVTVTDDPAAQAAQVRRLAAARGVPVRTARVGETGHDGPMHWQVLWPERVIQAGSVPNNASIVLLVQVAGLRLLLLGDVETEAASAVAAVMRTVPGGPAVDVVKVAHHGSAKQDPTLVRQSRPRLALISVGAGNDYGHPAPSALQLLRSTGATTGRTDLQGDLAVVVRQGRLSLVTSGPRLHDRTAVRAVGGDR